METNFKDYSKLSQVDLNMAFISACEKGNLKAVQYLLTSPELEKHADIHFKFDEGIKIAGRQGNLKMIKYFLTSPELQEHSDIGACDHENGDYSCFTEIICGLGQLTILKYLFRTQSIKNNLFAHRTIMFMAAFQNAQLPILEYLIFDFQIDKDEKIEDILKSFNCPPGFKLTVEDLFEFRIACHFNNYDTLKSLIFNEKIQLTPAINKFIRYKKEVKNMFEMRELNKKLEKELSSDKIVKKSVKI